ncbi:LysR family transcriptional regulator [Maritalea mediterranea]|uniref:LysR family transcriptional regulator n=1 Tax=Maritalea mediterranea TaxID=2909667 RepID=A0ABS9E670_9HYPH|nr:LysR family transcriptional regulator [Maritalea mediterranea]MCF4096961.1 LysR family transcriptional regulator [Maritalea mediterranea]
MALDPLPPLTALRAFDSAARHSSFTKAAEELNMTQAAVSYQIKQLEDRFGEPLFIRKARQVTLSEAGARLAPSVMEAFEIIRRGFAEAKGQRDDLLTITMVQTFASAWLARHLGGFHIYNGDVAVKVDISSHLIHDFQGSGMDIAIRSGHGDWPGMVCKKLFHFDYTVMAAPSFLEENPVEKPEDILGLSMASPHDPWWRTWLAAQGVDARDLARARGPVLDVQYINGIAAHAGHTLALLTPCLFQPELDNGSLVQPFDYVHREEKALWLCYPKGRENWLKVQRFEEWLFAKLDETMPNRRV